MIVTASQRNLATDLELTSTTLRAKGKIFNVHFVNGEPCTSTGPSSLQPPRRLHIGHFDVNDPTHLYIGRRHVDRQGRLFPNSFWSNPFHLRDCDGRQDCLARFAAHISKTKDLATQLATLSGKTLICHCRPSEECHGDILIRLFLELVTPSRPPGCGGSFSFGHFRTPEQFLRAARGLDHPFDRLAGDDSLKAAVLFVATNPFQKVIDTWKSSIAHWRRRAALLEPRERELHAAMHPAVAGVVQGKRLHLFREMLRSFEFPNADFLVDSMAAGFKIVGDLPDTGVFVQKPRPRGTPVRDLWRDARERQRTVLGSVRASGDSDLDAKVTATTQDELRRGWLAGPFTAEQLDRDLGLWLPAKRFGIRQGQDVRAIDDFSVAGHNGATTTGESIDMGGVDHVASLSRMLMQATPGQPMELQLDDGSTIGGFVPKGGRPEDYQLVGKEWDLKKAYRQLAVSPAHACFSVIAAWDAEAGQARLYRQSVLAFGAISSVHHFCWVARALVACLLNLFAFPVTHYVDNFPVITYDGLAPAAQAFLDDFFDLLGWVTKEQVPFEKSFVCLGVVFRFGQCLGVTNKPERLADLAAELAILNRHRQLPAPLAARIRGRLGFARAQVFGRLGGPALRALSRVETGSATHTDVRAALSALSQLVTDMQVMRPRRVPARFGTPILLFTDGACEPGPAGRPVVTIGAVLFQPGVRDPLVFGELVPDLLVDAWAGGTKTQVIGQAELAPVIVAKHLWQALLVDSALISFVDNEAAKFALISGTSPTPASEGLVHASAAMDAKLGIHQWVGRVPSESNPADDPSRLVFDGFATRCRSRLGPADWRCLSMAAGAHSRDGGGGSR